MKPALIVIDMQNDFKADSSHYACPMLDDKLIARVKKLVELCRANKIPIIWTQYSIKYDKSNADPKEPANVRACIIDTMGWQIIPELNPLPWDTYIRKNRADSFFKTNLEEILKTLGVDTLIFSGVYANNCVRTTAEAAYARDFDLLLIRDCCGAINLTGSMTPEEVNDYSIDELKERTYGTEVFTLAEFEESLSSLIK